VNVIVYGAECSWWDDIDHAAENVECDACSACGKVHQLAIPLKCQRGDLTPHRGVPCCPHCGGPLYMQSADEWWLEIHTRELTSPLFGELVRWARGQCFPDLDACTTAFFETAHRQRATA
jgi:hypothetical protein